MASVKWTRESIRSLARHDKWRVSEGWDPIAKEIKAAVANYFINIGEIPIFLPGRPAELEGEPTDLRVVFIEVRSTDFRVFYRYLAEQKLFEIRFVLHPKAQ